MMRRRITDAQMLTAARRQLADHLATRPATRSEATQIADRHRARAAQLRSYADQIDGASEPSVGWRPGPDTIRARHAESRDGVRLMREGSGMRNQAKTCESRARAWELVASGPDGAAWEETRVEYQGRVDYYAGL